MNPIKAIPTNYNGIIFRSRLEAKWAFFMDKLGIKYQYELEGYRFNNKNYLPDFYLPDWEMFVEVKPSLDFLKSTEGEKVLEFANLQKNGMLLFVDVPNKKQIYCRLWTTAFIKIVFNLDSNLITLKKTNKMLGKIAFYPADTEYFDLIADEASNKKFTNSIT